MGKVATNVKKKVNRKNNNEVPASETTPFDKSHVITPMKMVVSIVPYGQANGMIKILNDLECSMTLITNGEGTFQRETTLTGSKKQIVFGFLKEDKIEEFKQRAEKRFSTSSATKGVAFTVRLTSVAGVSVYKFLTNSRNVVKRGKSHE